MLLTERQLSRRNRLIFPQPDRIQKVRKSIGAIKQVLGERKRSYLETKGQSEKNSIADFDQQT
jgi:ribosomal protein L29